MKATMEKAAALASSAKAYKADFDWHNRGRGLSMCISDAVAHVEALDDQAATAALSQGGGPPRRSSLAAETAHILKKAREKIREAHSSGKPMSLSDAVSYVEMEELARNASTLASRDHAGRRGVAFEAMQLLSDARRRIQDVKAGGGSLSLADAISMGDAAAPEAFRLLARAGAFIQTSSRSGRKVGLADAVSAVTMA